MPNWKKIIVSGSDASLSSAYIEGNLTASAAYLTSASIGHLETIYETASVIYTSGSTKFGDTSDDTHERTGSLLVSGNITLSEGTQLTGSIFGAYQNANSFTGSFLNNTGYIVLTEVSESLNFANDSAAQAGGVPLGGLYRNGSDIKIRIS